MENKVINPSYHEHPLILTKDMGDAQPIDCYVCGETVTNLEATYVCEAKPCRGGFILHKKCGELPDQICHPKHSQHPLFLHDYHYLRNRWCHICARHINVLGYKCYLCDFNVDITCEVMGIDAILENKNELQHPSHPDHPLTLMRQPGFAFFCDGCGDQDVDMAYICSICEFWIHKTCASLPPILPTNCHHHPLSLVFTLPDRYRRHIMDCDVCGKRLKKARWVYFCGDCRFAAHLKCVTSTAETIKRLSNLGEDDNDGSDMIEFPLHAQDISTKLITPFVMRENKITDLRDVPTTIKMPETTADYSLLFNYHKHHLTLVSESYEDHNEIISDEDEDEDDTTNVKLKICDLCITPISSPPYYECVSCKYFVHSICYALPKTISSSSSSSPHISHLFGHCPKIQNENHTLTLYTSSKSVDMSIDMYRCTCCGLVTNGVMYQCEGCEMKIDVKCASLPPTILHASHPHHKSLTKRLQKGGRTRSSKCCGDYLDGVVYCCNNDDCDFALHIECVMLPASVMMLEWDKHPLVLTFDASLDHPSDFICGFCEGYLHPKKWMYHCRQCDNSFHCFCLKAAFGGYRNIKFGRRFVLDGIHHHPLTFNCVTIKKRCDICHCVEYDYCGLECALCNYLVCIVCAIKALASLSLSPN